MLHTYKTQILSVVWVSIVLFVAAISGLDTSMAWLLTAVVAVGPPAVLLHFSREVPQTTSERIHRARQ
jgi:hypothetical protein